LKVSKGALVLMKGVRCGSLYILQGSIMIGSATVTSSLLNENLTRLWHGQLGHISKKGMTILSKRGLFGSEGTDELDFYDHCVF